MKTILYVANEVKYRRLDLTGAKLIVAESREVTTYGEEGGRYIDWVEVEAEQLGYDTYSFELAPEEFTIEELQAYMAGPFEEELRVYNAEKQAAVARIAQLSDSVQGILQEILELANKYNVPANIKIGKHTNDFRKVDAVDWDSSSMYC